MKGLEEDAFIETLLVGQNLGGATTDKVDHLMGRITIENATLLCRGDEFSPKGAQIIGGMKRSRCYGMHVFVLEGSANGLEVAQIWTRNG